MRNTLALAAVAASAFMGGIAHADVYTLNVDHCSSPGCTIPAGKVYVTQNGANTIHIDVELTGLDYFNEAGGGNSFDSVEFSLANNNASIKNVSNKLFSADSSHNINGSAFGKFNYGVDYIGKNGNFNGGKIQSLSFDVTETGLTPGSLLDEKGVEIAVDVASIRGDKIATGLVGGTLLRGVPEPATWALLILGVAMIGIAARRRRAATPLAA